MNQQKTCILIVDDHAIVRQGIRALLEREPDIEIVGEATDGNDALEKIKALRPHIALLDISMPGMTGLDVAPIVQKEYPDTRVVLLTMHEEAEYFFQAIASGAAGYVIKGASGDELLAAIRAVVDGGVYLQPSLAKELVGDYLRHKQTASFDGLTPREAEILVLIADGLPTKDIAERLYISATTVQTHRAHIMEKLGLHSQADLIKYAIRKGILKSNG